MSDFSISLFSITNLLYRRLRRCSRESRHVKIRHFRAYCMCLYLYHGLMVKYLGHIVENTLSDDSDVYIETDIVTSISTSLSSDKVFSTMCPKYLNCCRNTNKVNAVRWPEVWKFYGSLTLLHFRTRDRVSYTARGKDNDQQNLSKMIM